MPTEKLPPHISQLFRDCLGAMQAMRHQIDQMSGMFNDTDGTIQEACDAHDETAEAVDELLDGQAVPQTLYLVMWERDISAGSSREAAEKALSLHRNRDSAAAVFHVVDEQGSLVVCDLDKNEQSAPTPPAVQAPEPV